MAEWDNPVDYEQHVAGRNQSAGTLNAPANARRNDDGLLDPIAFIRFIFNNLGKIFLLGILFAAIGIGIFHVIPFPYTAKAIILVDPRAKGVTVSEQVVTNIDGDAAVLASVVELVQSDGFLRPLLDSLNVASDPQFDKAAKSSNAGDDRKLLEAFQKGLSVLRVGATYVVEVKYTSLDSNKSAYYANGVAQAFVDAQSSSQVEATASAANSLSGRLNDLREALQKSEKAVANFRTKNNIVNVDTTSTLKQRELSELSQQVAQAKSQTEVWRAQYDQVLNSNGNIFNTLGDQAENQQLQLLGQQRNLVTQNLAELNLTFGARHPRIAAEQSKLTSLDRQIREERQRLISLSKRRLDAAVATQKALQNDLEQLRDTVANTETTLVTLAELEREAGANREIYQNFLSRFKSADQQQGFQNQEARLVSKAAAPLNTNRPSRVLASGLITMISFILSTMLIFLHAAMTGKRPAFNQAGATNLEPSHNHLNAQNGQMAIAPQYPARQSLDLTPRPHLPSPASRKTLAHDRTRPMPSNTGTAQPSIDPVGNYGFQPPRAAKPAIAAKAAEPIVGLTHIPRSNLRNEFDLERALADQLSDVPQLLPNQRSKKRNGSGNVILVSSWFPREGKTLISQSIATLAAANQFDSILIKTPVNSTVESQRGYSSTGMYRPYTILDPISEEKSNLPVNLTSFSALEAIVAECRKAFELVVLDASHVSNEQNFAHLSSACDKTLIILDRPDDNKINIIADRTTKSNFKDVKIVLNNL